MSKREHKNTKDPVCPYSDTIIVITVTIGLTILCVVGVLLLIEPNLFG